MSEVYVLGIGGSPRRGGNSDILLDAALEGAAESGARVEKIVLNELAIAPCQECGGCDRTGRCIVMDDMQLVYPKLRFADRFILASPVFFCSLSAQMKAMIDRTQACWVERHVLKRSIADTQRERRGIFISVGARGGGGNFEAAEKIIRVFYATQKIDFEGSLLFPNVDTKRAITQQPEAIHTVQEAGRELVLLETGTD